MVQDGHDGPDDGDDQRDERAEELAVGVGEGDRVVVAVGVAVDLLRVAEIGDGVDADEAPGGRAVVTGAEVDKAGRIRL
ncbi:hypothetical protein ACFWA5_16410 [Streptomyces mirabilis]|uniref:hypothetical protein n=1 Tax=Streptomyces mirabilis TaxID=68239 RepID=UPI00364A6B2C